MSDTYPLGLNRDSSQLMQDVRRSIDGHATDGKISQADAEPLKALVPAYLRQHNEVLVEYIGIEPLRMEDFIERVIAAIKEQYK
jgi:hypothetical protein